MQCTRARQLVAAGSRLTVSVAEDNAVLYAVLQQAVDDVLDQELGQPPPLQRHTRQQLCAPCTCVCAVLPTWYAGSTTSSAMVASKWPSVVVRAMPTSVVPLEDRDSRVPTRGLLCSAAREVLTADGGQPACTGWCEAVYRVTASTRSLKSGLKQDACCHDHLRIQAGSSLVVLPHPFAQLQPDVLLFALPDPELLHARDQHVTATVQNG